MVGGIELEKLTNFRLMGIAWADNGNPSFRVIEITDAPHYVEVLAHRSSSPGGMDGFYKMWIDGVLQSTVSNVSNCNRFGLTNRLEFGTANGVVAGVTGTFYIGEIKANRDGSLIGP